MSFLPLCMAGMFSIDGYGSKLHRIEKDDDWRKI